MTISQDKGCLAALDDNRIHLFDLKTGELQRSLNTRTSPDGQLLASINRQEIILWDLYAQRRPQALRTGEYVNWTSELVFSADGSRLRTTHGMLPLPSASNSLSQPPSTIPADLALIEEWVTWKMARVLWIPNLLINKFFVAGNVVVFVPDSGHSGLPIWIGFDPSKRPTDEALVNRFRWEDAPDSELYPVHRRMTLTLNSMRHW